MTGGGGPTGVVFAVALIGTSYLPFAHALRHPLAHRKEKPREQQFWYKWSRGVQHRPWPAVVVARCRQ